MDHTDIPLPSQPRYNRNNLHPSPGSNITNYQPRLIARNTHNHRPTQLSLDKLSSGGLGQPSSDPPLFSSDDFQSSALENYRPGSRTGSSGGDGGEGVMVRKRRYRGTWWGEKLQPKKKRTEFKKKRNMDSGVWLSDDEDGDDEESVMLATSGGRAGDDRIVPSCLDESPRRQVAKVNKVVESEAHRSARITINRCLEEGNDNVDLSYFNMATIPPDMFRPLAQLTREPTIKERPLTDEAYSPLEPFLRLFLTRNLLPSISREIFDLHDLKVLSLRHNKLTEIPSAIEKLTLLQDLNVAGNRLRHLPWEILNLLRQGELKQLTVHPNPFIDLNESDVVKWNCDVEGNSREGETESSIRNIEMDNHNNNNISNPRLKAKAYSGQPIQEAWGPVLVATGAIEYFDMEGRPIIKPTSKFDNVRHSASIPTRVPSLRELALQACTRSPHFPRFLEEEEEDEEERRGGRGGDSSSSPTPTTNLYSDPILRLLMKAREVRETGEKRCSVCSRSFVIDRVRWVEWWDCMPFENGSKSPRKSGQNLYPLPFLRKGCSWACIL